MLLEVDSNVLRAGGGVAKEVVVHTLAVGVGVLAVSGSVSVSMAAPLEGICSLLGGT